MGSTKIEAFDLADALLEDINTIDTNTEAIQENAADIDALETEMATVKKSVSDGKSLLAEAITTKGISTATDASFETMATNIINIPVLDTSDANATAGDILSGKTAYVNGLKVSGSIESLGAQTITPKASAQTIAAGKFLSGAQTIAGDANLVAGNIAKGKSIFGVSGTYDPSMVLNTTTCGRKRVGTTSTSGTLTTTITKPLSGSGIVIIEPDYNNVIICRILVEIPSLNYVMIDKNAAYESPSIGLYAGYVAEAMSDTGKLSLNTDYGTTYSRLTFYFNITTSGSNYILKVYKNGSSNNVYAIYAGVALS